MTIPIILKTIKTSENVSSFTAKMTLKIDDGFLPSSLECVIRQIKLKRMFSNCISVKFTVKQIHRLVLHFQRRVVQKSAGF